MSRLVHGPEAERNRLYAYAGTPSRNLAPLWLAVGFVAGVLAGVVL